MTDKGSEREAKKAELGKALAQETVGKLIGDDHAVRTGQKKQAATRAALRQNDKKEKE